MARQRKRTSPLHVRISPLIRKKLGWIAHARGQDVSEVVRTVIYELCKDAMPPETVETTELQGDEAERRAWLDCADSFRTPFGEAARKVLNDWVKRRFGRGPRLVDGRYTWKSPDKPGE